ncbi:macro domain protein (macronuclear) [Tetrahymena thermophila SB210]|uniref:Macro domain protein n=1 Tax=Tetrahymena thermophila (strain SB210) TaxID=312017 RepID=Q231D5_TETTS|nr:macro domain protein [Tetrahymena thermophila SB210]EAR91104.3 macro domain protein [Tetrahymena thermophila SB210]|eukprot:XP_001011349.3 macro domain protein [Tetrahymena thermophila SB210]
MNQLINQQINILKKLFVGLRKKLIIILFVRTHYIYIQDFENNINNKQLKNKQQACPTKQDRRNQRTQQIQFSLKIKRKRYSKEGILSFRFKQASSIMGNLCQTKPQIQQIEKIENPPEKEVFTLITEKKYQQVIFKLYDGNAIKYQADGLINANENPYFVDNHSLMVNTKKELINQISQKDPLNPGEASYTSTGLPNLTYFIHCCLPSWQGGQDGGKNELYYCIQAYYNSFKIANELSMKKIVFTDQNTSLQQIPKNLSAEAFIKAALKFINENQESELEEVIIINKNKVSNNAMKNQINGQLSVDMNDELKQMIIHKESAFLDNTERSIRETFNRTDTLSNADHNHSMVKQNNNNQILTDEQMKEINQV